MVPDEILPASGRAVVRRKGLRRYLATSDRALVRRLRRWYRRVEDFTIPAPRILYLPLLYLYLAVRTAIHWLTRVLICEPFLKVQCKSYGRHVRASIFLHWIRGKGDIILGDYVILDGKISISFAARYSDRPTLIVGDRSRIGHNSMLSIAKQITIGRCCRISSDVFMFDSSGHASDPSLRISGAPALDEDVKPITICDNVWIGRRCTIFPGVTIGEGSILATGSVVMSDVPPYTVVAGNPARKIGTLEPAPPDAVEKELERMRTL